MIVVDIAAWAATATILATYLLAARRPATLWRFHVANAIGCAPIGWSAWLHGALPSLALTGAFGLIGYYGLIQHRRRRLDEGQRATRYFLFGREQQP